MCFLCNKIGFFGFMFIFIGYNFDIKGKFHSFDNFLGNAYIELETSDGRKIKTECTPLESFNKFSCDIKLIKYPLDNVDVILPINAPNTKAYTFLNWEQTIGASPGKSNVFSKINCLPEESNVFIPSSIEING